MSFAGTVVFDTITKKDRFDFYLSSLASGRGTITPTHYNVVEDTTPFLKDPSKLMELALAQTMSYYNWCGAIRVPAVCQYAHKLASLVGENLLGNEADLALRDTLYYL